MIKRFFTKHRFRKEIAFALILKVLGLFLLWWLCFSHPVSPQLNGTSVMQHLVE